MLLDDSNSADSVEFSRDIHWPYKWTWHTKALDESKQSVRRVNTSTTRYWTSITVRL